MWTPTAEPLVRAHLDGLLLLIARGATVHQAAETIGCSGRTLERWLPRVCPAGYADALAARPHLRDDHGTPARYQVGCRCVECRNANRLATAAYTARRRSA